MQEATARRIDDAGAWPLPAGIRLTPIDLPLVEPIERLLDLAFGYDRHQRTAYRLREGVAARPQASFAAFDGDRRLVGSIQTWPLALMPEAGVALPLWLVGPIAVHPDARNRGVGRAMLARVLDEIDTTPHPALLIGDAPYYAPFGFSAEHTAGWSVPGPVDRHRLLLRAPDGATLPATGMLGPRLEV